MSHLTVVPSIAQADRGGVAREALEERYECELGERAAFELSLADEFATDDMGWFLLNAYPLLKMARDRRETPSQNGSSDADSAGDGT